MIHLKSEDEILAMKPSCKLAARVLDMIESHVIEGVSTLKLNNLCHEFILDHKAIPAPLNYMGFPKSICTSVNEVVCHGIPKKADILKNGDIINIDITTILDGYHGDTSRTFYVGTPSEEAKKLVEITKQSMHAGIDSVKLGGQIGDIGAAIQGLVEPKGYSVVESFVGHGIGKNFHEDPQIPHKGIRGRGVRFEPGMVFTIEPMINVGVFEVDVLEDKWTAVTRDGKLSAQFEHTLAIHEDGSVEILTVSS